MGFFVCGAGLDTCCTLYGKRSWALVILAKPCVSIHADRHVKNNPLHNKAQGVFWGTADNDINCGLRIIHKPSITASEQFSHY